MSGRSDTELETVCGLSHAGILVGILRRSMVDLKLSASVALIVNKRITELDESCLRIPSISRCTESVRSVVVLQGSTQVGPHIISIDYGYDCSLYLLYPNDWLGINPQSIKRYFLVNMNLI